MSKRLSIILTLTLIALVGVFCVWKQRTAVAPVVSNPVVTSQPAPEPTQSDTPIDTSDWKTYRNEEYGFEVKYPKEFRLDTKPRNNGFIVSFLEFDKNAIDLTGSTQPGYYPQISLYQWNDINDPNLKGGNWEGEKLYKNFQEFLNDSVHTNIAVTGSTSISGNNAFVLSMPGEIGYEAIMFEHGGHYFRIAFPESQKKLEDSVRNAFTSSFVFSK